MAGQEHETDREQLERMGERLAALATLDNFTRRTLSGHTRRGDDDVEVFAGERLEDGQVHYFAGTTLEELADTVIEFDNKDSSEPTTNLESDTVRAALTNSESRERSAAEFLRRNAPIGSRV
jgi:hypothetical protein